MKKMRKLYILALAFLISGCQTVNSSSNSLPNSNSSSSPSVSSVSSSSSSSSANENKKVTEIRFIKKTINVDLNGTAQLSWKIMPSDASNKKVSFMIKDDTIALVDENGLITGKKVGSTTVTIITEDGNLQDTATINVIGQQATGIKIIVPEGTLQDDKGTYLMKIGDRLKLNYELTPANSVNKVTYAATSDNGSVETYLSINDAGLIKALNLKTKIEVSISTDNLMHDSIMISIVKDSIYNQYLIKDKLSKSISLEQQNVVSGTKSIIHKYPKRSTDDETNETFNIYSNGISTQTTKIDHNLNKTKNYSGFIGIYNNDYYEINRTTDNVYNATSKSSIGDKITLEDAQKQSSLINYRTHYGLANIIIEEYVNSTNYLNYTGDWNEFKATTNKTNGTITINGSYEKKETYGYYSSNLYRVFSLIINMDNDMVKSYTFECNDYDETSYDFTKQELKSNPTALEYTKHEFVQQTGTREENNNFGVTPSQCYFTDYSIKTYSIEDDGNYNNFEVGDYISFKIDTFAPSTATTSIDSIKYKSSSDNDVATYSSMGGLKAVGEGTATLTFVSSNGVEKTVDVVVNYKQAETIEINFDAVGVEVNKTVENITASVLPNGSNPNYSLSIVDGNEFAELNYVESTKSYSLKGLKEGKVTLKAQSLDNENIVVTKDIYVYSPLTSDKVLSTLLNSKYQVLAGNGNTYILVFNENGKGEVKDGFESYSTTYGYFDYEVDGFTVKISNVTSLNGDIFYSLENLTMDISGLTLTGKMATSKTTSSKKTYIFEKI